MRCITWSQELQRSQRWWVQTLYTRERT